MLVRNFIFGVASAALLIGSQSVAQEAPPKPSIPVFDEVPAPFAKETEHQTTINGQRVRYKVIAGDTYLKDTAGNVTGTIFSFSYIRTDTSSVKRPVLFVFNGGPGAASLWQHIGVLGPKQLVLDSDVNPSSVPPFGLEENHNSILDTADIVFIDPIGTGYSRALNGTDPREFWGVDEDADSIAQFIELWLTENGRWNSPKYLMGESYGSIRASVLPRALMGSPIYTGLMRGISVDGVILLGTTVGDSLGAQSSEPTPEEKAASDARSLPGLAATAAYHGLAPGKDDIASVYTSATSYAMGPYKEALLKLGQDSLASDEREEVLSELSRLLGVPKAAIGDDLYIGEREFAKRALASKGLELGMYDSRYTLPLENSGLDPVADDPAMAQYVPGFVAAFHDMMRQDLGLIVDRPYYSIRWRELLMNWNWKRAGGPKIPKTYAEELAWAMRRNPDLEVMVASGYFDLVTTLANAKAQLEAGGIPQDRVRYADYESGHMLYLGGTSDAFSNDLREFLKARH